MSQGCAGKVEGKPSQFTLHPLSHCKAVIGVVSGKGGVGKSFISASLATTLINRGYKVGILDADITGPSIPKLLNVSNNDISSFKDLIFPAQAKNGCKIISANLILEREDEPILWRGPLITSALKQFYSDCDWGDLDVLLIDMPPGTSDIALTILQCVPLSGLLLVSTPQNLVQMIVGKALNMAKQLSIPILGMVENMSYLACDECQHQIELYGKSKLADTCAHYDIPALDRVPLIPSLAAVCDEGKLIDELPDEWLEKTLTSVQSLID